MRVSSLVLLAIVATTTTSSVSAFAPPQVSSANNHHALLLSPRARPIAPKTVLHQASRQAAEEPQVLGASDTDSEEYKQGFAIISFITLLNASVAPIWHAVFAENGPPPLFLNAVVSVVAFSGLLAGGSLLEKSVDSMSNLAGSEGQQWSKKSFRGGMELGFWKALGTTCHVCGLALTTANHGAFLSQLTTLIVPVLQAIRGEKLSTQIKLSVVLALAGIVAFTQDPGGTAAANTAQIDAAQIQLGDALCVGAAIFYSLYDIQTFYWGREIPRTELVTIKIGFQAILSCLLCAAVNAKEVEAYIASGPDYTTVIPTILWSGLIVNALATFLQVGGMQAVGPTRAQTIFASQPLWAGCANFVFLGEVVGLQGVVGGGAFLGALFLAATAKPDEPSASTATE